MQISSSKLWLASLLTLGALLHLPLSQPTEILGLFNHPGKSHFDFFRPLFIGLAEAGHNITMISYFPNKKPMANYTDLPLKGMDVLTDMIDLNLFEGSFEFIPMKIPTFFMLHYWGLQSCEFAFQSDVIKNLLQLKRKFDVIILEHFNNDCMMAIAHQLKAPVIALSSCSMMPWHYGRMGSPMIPSFMPVNLLPHSDEMNFVERVNNFIHFSVLHLVYNAFTQTETNALIRKYYGSNIPPVEDLVKNTELMLINQHFSLTGAYPYSPNIIEVSGLQIPKESPLEPEFKRLLDEARPGGVVYVSWGSMVRPDTLPLQKRAALLSAIAQFPDYTFLMRWPNDTLENKPENLITRSWMPQRDILCHPNVKAFITHGGLLGSSEATYCGVPMVVTPFYGDQFLNSRAIEKRKIGVVVSNDRFTEANIVQGLKTILQPSFARQAKLVSESYRVRAIKALDLAIWWVEEVINTQGSPFTHSHSKYVHWFIYYSFDIYLFFLALFAILFIVTKSCLRLCCSILRPKTGSKLKTQ